MDKYWVQHSLQLRLHEYNQRERQSRQEVYAAYESLISDHWQEIKFACMTTSELADSMLCSVRT